MGQGVGWCLGSYQKGFQIQIVCKPRCKMGHELLEEKPEHAREQNMLHNPKWRMNWNMNLQVVVCRDLERILVIPT